MTIPKVQGIREHGFLNAGIGGAGSLSGGLVQKRGGLPGQSPRPQMTRVVHRIPPEGPRPMAAFGKGQSRIRTPAASLSTRARRSRARATPSPDARSGVATNVSATTAPEVATRSMVARWLSRPVPFARAFSAVASRCSPRPGRRTRRRRPTTAQLGQLAPSSKSLASGDECSIVVIQYEKCCARHTRSSARRLVVQRRRSPVPTPARSLARTRTSARARLSPLAPVGGTVWPASPASSRPTVAQRGRRRSCGTAARFVR